VRVLAGVVVDVEGRISLAIPCAACAVPVRGLELEADALGIDYVPASCAEWWSPLWSGAES